jgi:hypothetical protein
MEFLQENSIAAVEGRLKGDNFWPHRRKMLQIEFSVALATITVLVGISGFGTCLAQVPGGQGSQGDPCPGSGL